MSKQIVISGTRILAYGENCFLTFGDRVICTNTDKCYPNASVVECDSLPPDIDSVGYEYHAGNFVPCAPFGKGEGTIAVFCNEDCKALKDSGIPSAQVGQILEGNVISYETKKIEVTFTKKPKIIFITTSDASGVVFASSGFGFLTENDTTVQANAGGHVNAKLTLSVDGLTATISKTNGQIGWGTVSAGNIIAIC